MLEAVNSRLDMPIATADINAVAFMGDDQAGSGTGWFGTLAYTSFEEPRILTGFVDVRYYVDELSAMTDHVLARKNGENPVTYTACTRGLMELGFASFYVNSLGTVLMPADGLTDGDAFGVVGDTSTPQGGGGGGVAPHVQQFS